MEAFYLTRIQAVTSGYSNFRVAVPRPVSEYLQMLRYNMLDVIPPSNFIITPNYYEKIVTVSNFVKVAEEYPR